jgi:hypothetical protein
MTNIYFYPNRLIKRLSVFAIILILATLVHSIVLADSEGKVSDTDLSRILRKGGRISDVDFISGKIVVNGIEYRIDMQKTRLITIDNQPIDYFSLDKDLLIRFAVSNDEEGEKNISVIQITGPKKRLEALINQ